MVLSVVVDLLLLKCLWGVSFVFGHCFVIQNYVSSLFCNHLEGTEKAWYLVS